MPRSATGRLTVATADAELLARFRSVSPLTAMVFAALLMVPAELGITTTVTVALEPAVTAPRLQVTWPAPFVTGAPPCEEVVETKVALPGSVLVKANVVGLLVPV